MKTKKTRSTDSWHDMMTRAIALWSISSADFCVLGCKISYNIGCRKTSRCHVAYFYIVPECSRSQRLVVKTRSSSKTQSWRKVCPHHWLVEQFELQMSKVKVTRPLVSEKKCVITNERMSTRSQSDRRHAKLQCQRSRSPSPQIQCAYWLIQCFLWHAGLYRVMASS